MATEKDIVFLLGAGASHDAGLPLMPELTSGFLPWLQKREDLDTAAKASNVALYRAATSAVTTNGDPNIERVLELLANVERFKIAAERSAVTGWHEPFNATPDQLHGLVEQVRIYIRERLGNVGAENGSYLSGLLDFKTSSDKPVDIFSLDYDLLVEIMAARYEVHLTTGFGEFWDPSLFDVRAQAGVFPGWDIRLFKLHGSLDWYRLGSRPTIYRGTAEHWAFPGEATSDLILYPAGFKEVFRDPFSTLMTYFNRRLQEAEFLVAVGYSFGDPHITRVVADRVATNRRLQIIAVGPHAGVAIAALYESEPSLQATGRVIGLWQTAKNVLENRLIATRLAEISQVDKLIETVVLERTSRAFWSAAGNARDAVYAAVEAQMPAKVGVILAQIQGGELAAALEGRAIEQAVPALKETRAHAAQNGDGTWNVEPLVKATAPLGSGPTDLSERLRVFTIAWLMLSELEVAAAGKVEASISQILHQITSGLLLDPEKTASRKAVGNGLKIAQFRADFARAWLAALQSDRAGTRENALEHYFPKATGGIRYKTLLHGLPMIASTFEDLLKIRVNIDDGFFRPKKGPYYPTGSPEWLQQVSDLSRSLRMAPLIETWNLGS